MTWAYVPETDSHYAAAAAIQFLICLTRAVGVDMTDKPILFSGPMVRTFTVHHHNIDQKASE